MNRFVSFAAALLFALATQLVAAAGRDEPKSEVTWQALLFDGVKVGHAMSERREVDGTVSTREVMAIEIRRSGEPVRVDSDTTYIESSEGKPLSFNAQTRASTMEMRVIGTVTDGIAHIQTSNGGQTTHSSVAMGAGLLGEGQRLKLVRSGLKPGQTISFTIFEPIGQRLVEVTTRVIGPRRVEVYDRTMQLIEVEQTVHYPESPITARAFVDAQFRPYRTSLDLLGMKIEQVSCDRSCALKENQTLDHLQQLLVQAPRAISATESRAGVRYTLSRRRGDQPLQLPNTSEQRARTLAGNTVQLDVCPRCGNVKSDQAELATATEATHWLQSDHPEMIELARQAAGKTQSVAERMRNLERFVRGYIRTKDLSVGYASALETLRNRNGDCTEHALLLAALARASGIPARVVSGFAYVDQFGEDQHVFVPHAWTTAWIDGRWQSFDAAMNGFDAGHIALAVGDGDPSRFYAGMNLFGELRVNVLQSLPKSRP